MVLEEALRNGLILCEKGMSALEGRCPYFHRGTGYWLLTDDKQKKYLHRFIAQSMLDNPYGHKYINHIDGNKQNNSVSNLEWCTQSHNNKHAYDIGLRHPAWSGKRGASNPSSIPVVGVHQDTAEVIAFESGLLAKDYGFNNCHISACINDRAKTHKGYRWYRADDPRLLALT